MAREIYGALLIDIFDCHNASNNRNRIRVGMHLILKRIAPEIISLDFFCV